MLMLQCRNKNRDKNRGVQHERNREATSGALQSKVDFDEMKADLNANLNYQWKVISC